MLTNIRKLAIIATVMPFMMACEKQVESTETNVEMLKKKPATTNSMQVLTTGLNHPRGLKFGPDGKLYVSNWGFSPTAIGGGEILQISIGDSDN